MGTIENTGTPDFNEELKELRAFKDWAIKEIQDWQDSYNGFYDSREEIIDTFNIREVDNE
jgi:hypothetical protein